jgi:hypothetical protein
MPTLKTLAEEYATTVEALRQASNVGPNVNEDDALTPLQEQNVRGTWLASQSGGGVQHGMHASS